MTLIISIIGVIALFSVVDYFQSRTWQNVTSAQRNDVVFKNRNQDYGAFAMRRDYNKHLLIILCSFITTLGISYAGYCLVKEDRTSDNVLPDTFIGPTCTLNFPPLEKKQEEEKKEEHKEEAKLKSNTDVVVFPPPVASDSPVDSTSIKPIENDQIAGLKAIEGDPGSNGTTPSAGGDGPGTNPTIVEEVDSASYVSPDVFPDFPGGPSARTKFIVSHTRLPQELLDDDLPGGVCQLRFVVSMEGEVQQVQVLKGVPECPTCNAEAIRTLKAMPRWTPGKKNGKPVNSYFTIKINFEPAY